MKIHVVNNGGQWTHREWRVLRELGADSRIIPNTTPLEEIRNERLDGLLLSGGAASLISKFDMLGLTGKYIDHAGVPILGLCVSHQFMVLHFGGRIGPAETPEFGRVKMAVKGKSPLFKGIPPKFIAWASHNDEVKELPADFEVTAFSDDCRVHGIQHRKMPLFGLQYHPEVEHSEYGREIFRNFMDICRAYGRSAGESVGGD